MDIKNNSYELILQSKSLYSNLVVLNCLCGNYKKIKRNKELENIKINGVFDFLDEKFFAIYVFNKKIFIKIENNIIEFHDGIKISTEVRYEKKNFSVIENNKVILNIKYSIKNNNIFDGDLTAFLDDEDFDFGLFLKNILSNPDRRRIIIENWC